MQSVNLAKKPTQVTIDSDAYDEATLALAQGLAILNLLEEASLAAVEDKRTQIEIGIRKQALVLGGARALIGRARESLVR